MENFDDCIGDLPSNLSEKMSDIGKQYKSKKRRRKPIGRAMKPIRITRHMKQAVRQLIDEIKADKAALEPQEENMLLFDFANRVKQLVEAEPKLYKYAQLLGWAMPLVEDKKWKKHGFQVVNLRGKGFVDFVVRRHGGRFVSYWGTDFAWNEFLELVALRAKYKGIVIPKIDYQDVRAEWNGNEIVRLGSDTQADAVPSESMPQAETVPTYVATDDPWDGEQPEEEALDVGAANASEDVAPADKSSGSKKLFEFGHRRSQLVKLLTAHPEVIDATHVYLWARRRGWEREQRKTGAVFYVQFLGKKVLHWGDEEAWASYMRYVEAAAARCGLESLP